MVNEFHFLLWIDILSVLLVIVSCACTILINKCDRNTTEAHLIGAIVSFILGVVAWINISTIFNL